MDVPRVYIVVPNPEEKSVKADLFQKALEMGMELPKQYAYDELAIPMPGDSEEVLTPDDLARAVTAPADGSTDDSEPSPSGDDSPSSGQLSGFAQAARGDAGGEAE